MLPESNWIGRASRWVFSPAVIDADKYTSTAAEVNFQLRGDLVFDFSEPLSSEPQEGAGA